MKSQGSQINAGRQRLPDKTQLIWLFFRLSGRISRAAYVLAVLLLIVVQGFLAYRFVIEANSSAEEFWVLLAANIAAGRFWAVALGLSIVIWAWVHVALGVKRLHDMGKPGILALTLFIPVISFIPFVILCVLPGDPGPNRYGPRTNDPG